MDNATGPTYTLEETELALGDANHVQEALAIIGFDANPSYALLGYVPASPRSVQIFKDGLFLLQGTDYTIDGRKIAFTASFTGDGGNPEAAVEVAQASYITTNTVATIPAVEIAFDIPGRDFRVNGVSGSLQSLIAQGTDPETYLWHDLISQTDPVTGIISYVVYQTASPNQ